MPGYTCTIATEMDFPPGQMVVVSDELNDEARYTDAELDAATVAAAEAWDVPIWHVSTRPQVGGNGYMATIYYSAIDRFVDEKAEGTTRLAAVQALEAKAKPNLPHPQDMSAHDMEREIQRRFPEFSVHRWCIGEDALRALVRALRQRDGEGE